jgi:hypothetical protein
MTSDHLAALLALAEASPDTQGWTSFGHGRHLTLHVATSGGVSLAVGRIEALKVGGPLVTARTAKGELYVVRLEDVFAGAVEAAGGSARKAGFV